MSALSSLSWDWLCVLPSFLSLANREWILVNPASALSLKSSHLFIYLATGPVEIWKTRVSSFFSCLFSLLPSSSSSHSNQSYMYTDLRLTFLRCLWNHLSLKKTLSGSAPTTWLNANTSSWQSKAEGLLVDFPVFLSRSPVYIGRFQSVCGTWPIHHASVKNCNESKIPSQLQPSKVACYSFVNAGGLHETLEEKQRKPDFSVQKNCRVSAFWGLTPQAPLHTGWHREWDSKDGLCYRRGTNPELRKLQ